MGISAIFKKIKTLVIKRVRILLILFTCFLLSSFSAKYGPFTGIKTVVIDAGHGGKDPGCHGEKFNEKDIALAVALKLGEYIEKNFEDVKVVYTRKTDVFVELSERANIANRAGADLFICIHCNASPNKQACGSETYVMGLHKTKGNLDVAKRENAAILLEEDYKKKYEGFDPNSDEAAIIFSMYQNVYLTQSLSLSSKIQNHYKTKAGRTDKGVKQAGFLVLWKTAMPSLLTEIGFLTNPSEEKFLGSEKGQDYIASSIFLAFREYKNEIEGKLLMKYNDELENKEPYKLSPADTTVPLKLTPVDSIKKDKIDPPEVKQKGNDGIGTPQAVGGNLKQEEEVDELVFFRVQVASSDKKIAFDSEKFKGMENIMEYVEGNLFKYTTGNYLTIDKASKLQKELREKGFNDAFLVAFRGDKRISMNDAIKLVKP